MSNLPKRSESLLVKIFWSISSVVIIGVIVAIGFELVQQDRFIRDLYSEHARSLSLSLDSTITTTDLMDPATVQNRLSKFVLFNTDVLEASMIMDQAGRLMITASSNQNRVGQAADRYSKSVISSGKQVTFPVVFSSDPALKIVTPLHMRGTVVGAYELVFSAASVKNQIRRQLMILGVVTLIATFIIMVFSGWILQKTVIHPIQDLVKGATLISSGDLRYRVPTRSDDEIGELARAFNDMTQKLATFQQGLEDRVKERTDALSVKIAEIEEMNKLMIGRENKMIELKKQIEVLRDKLAAYGDRNI